MAEPSISDAGEPLVRNYVFKGYWKALSKNKPFKHYYERSSAQKYRVFFIRQPIQSQL